MSFKDLKKARSTRESASKLILSPAQLAATSSSGESSDPKNLAAPSERTDSKRYEIPAGLYQQLGTDLEIRVSEAGRGLYVKDSVPSPIRAGTTLLELKPVVSALSTQSLPSCCSYCHTEVGGEKSEPLKRCTLCKVVYYDSTVCQNKDWPIHKLECAALRQWAASARQAQEVQSQSSVDAVKPDVIPIPGDAVRALGRIYWAMQLAGPTSIIVQEIGQMQSHRGSLDPKSPSQAVLTNLGHSFARYIVSQSDPTGLANLGFGLSSAAGFVDFLSRFTTNSFTLTSPSLTPLGVCVSPLAALINHSCAPNAVVVFPSRPTATPAPLKVVALRDLQPGEQILNSYVDVTMSGWKRRKELKETYLFDCACELCQKEEFDPRRSFKCTRCAGLTPFSADSVTSAPTSTSAKSETIECSRCGLPLADDAGDCFDAIRVAQEANEKASKLQMLDPQRALKYTSSSLALLSQFPLHPSSDPLLALTRLHLSLLIDALSQVSSHPAKSIDDQHERDAAVDLACRFAARCVTGVSGILTKGHPIRGIALAELGKLLCIDVSPEGSLDNLRGAAADEPKIVELKEGQDLSDALPPSTGIGAGGEAQLPRGVERLKLAAQVAARAREELSIGFGRGGGEVGAEVERMLRDLEREHSVWVRAAR
ncbi:SET domain-containing protein [Clavulina sp. PMI_390]|nr:SET domain-containing protein [Clavulina sp. PMI_390]